MIEAFDQWLQVPPTKLAIIAKVVSMLHSASLLYACFRFGNTPADLFCRVDDIEDDSQLRRGTPGM